MSCKCLNRTVQTFILQWIGTNINIMPLSLSCSLLLIIIMAGCQSTPDPYVASIVTEVNEVNLHNHIERLTSIGSRFKQHENAINSLYVSNPNAQSQKIAYLSQCFEECGYRVQQSSFPVPRIFGGKGINLIAFKEGSVEPNRVMELGAHYDTYGNPGANDNCSGVAGVLEVARIMADIPTGRSIRFCLYDLEEVGELLIGSKRHVKLVKDKAFHSKDEIFDGAIVFEMIGYSVNDKGTQKTPVRIPLLLDPPRVGNFILVLSNFKSGHLQREFEQAIETYVGDLDHFSTNGMGGLFKDAARSDHYSYWRAGLPAIMITDTGEFRNPNYHQESDTIETLNFSFLSKIVQATVGTLLDYAQPILDEYN